MKYKNNLRYKGSLLDKFVHAVLYYDYECPEKLSAEEKKLCEHRKGDKKLIELLPDNYKENYKFEVSKLKAQCAAGMEEKLEKDKLYYRLLLVNDFISGMTDTYAKVLYQELNGIY